MKKSFFSFSLMAVVVATVCMVITCKDNHPVIVTGVKLNKTELTLEIVGDTEQLIATIEPKNAANQNVSWRSSNNKVAEVDDEGLVTAKGDGTCDITVTTDDRWKEATCTVTVPDQSTIVIPVTGVSLDRSELTLAVTQKMQLNATVEPPRATNPNVRWRTSDARIATVSSSGLVEGISRGNIVITVTTISGELTATCDVAVVVAVTGMKLNKSRMDIILGRKHTLLAPIFSPTNDVDNKKIIWTSSNDAIASVDENGDISGKAIGTAVITAKTDDGGFTSTCEVTVKEDPYRRIQGFLRSAEGGKYVDDLGEVAIRGMGNIYNQVDFQKAASIGFNNVRYYMFARDYEPNNPSPPYDTYTWTKIDNAVNWARQYNLTLVLCMMDRPGTNNSTFFTNQVYQDRLVGFWRALADRYKDEKVISAYELMNEPPLNEIAGDTPPFPKTFDFYKAYVQRMVTAIREVDMNHNIVMEHPWLSGLQEPSLGFYNTTPNDQSDKWRNVNGEFNFPNISDPANNYTYTYHCYEPGRYVHQISQNVQTQFDCLNCRLCTDCDRVYPSNAVAKHFEYDPVTGQSWRMTKDFLDYVYTIPMDYCRNVKQVPVYIGELGVMSCNFTNNCSGTNRGARQYVLDLVDVLSTYRLSWSYHPFYVNEFYPNVYPGWEAAVREAFGKN